MTDDEATKREGPASVDDATKREGPSTDRPRPRETRDERLTRGTLVGRYVVLDELGAGGMGVVYSAYDPELDRKVAVKLLQADPKGGGARDQAWLLREAQAMARVSHPNVIAVYDVGTLPHEQVFVAMELVDGITLRKWLRETRTWREILPVMRAAGAGLAAAHAAGLVHRDFKPDNVLVGNDGRVRVLDFGLARLGGETGEAPQRDSSRSIDSRSPLGTPLTEAGAVIGTPAYMAPEILDGLAADARTDQFAFGVALYEALYQKRPFGKDKPQGQPERPAGSAVPARLYDVVARALAPEREARFASMDDLLAALAFDPGARRRRVLIGASTLVAAGAIGAAVLVASRQRAAVCVDINDRLTGVWDDNVRRALHAHYTTGRPQAEPIFAGLAHALDGYAVDWTRAAVDNCKATRVRGEQSEAVELLRGECDRELLDELRALVHLLGNADASVMDQGDRVTYGLTPPSRCANVAVLRGAPSVPTDKPEKLEAFRGKLAESEAQLLAGDYLAANTSADAARGFAEELHYEPFVAAAYENRGVALAHLGRDRDAHTAFVDATAAAIRGRRPDFEVRSVLGIASLEALPTGKAELAQIWLELADAMATQIGTDHELDMLRASTEGAVAAKLGNKQRALAAHEAALHAAEQVFGSDATALWAREMNYAAALTDAGECARALPHYEHALALLERSVGKDSSDIALVLTNLGVCESRLGKLDAARAAYARGLAIREKMYGANSPMLLVTLNNNADFLNRAGTRPARSP